MRTVIGGLVIDTQKMERLAELDVNYVEESRGIFGNAKTSSQKRTVTLYYGVDRVTGEGVVVSMYRRRFHEDGQIKLLNRSDVEALLEGHWDEDIAWDIYRKIYGEPHEVSSRYKSPGDIRTMPIDGAEDAPIKDERTANSYAKGYFWDTQDEDLCIVPPKRKETKNAD